MKAKKLFTLLTIAAMSVSIMACGKKETVQDLPAETTETVSVIDTETENEPETETEGAELVYNTETTEAVVAEGTVSAGTKDTSSTGSKTTGTKAADTAKNTDSSKNTTKSDNGNTGSTNNSGSGNTSAGNTSGTDTSTTQPSAPVTNPSTPEPEPTPEPTPEPSTNLNPYPLWTWVDFGNGVVGFYFPSNEDSDTYVAHCQQMQATIEANGYSGTGDGLAQLMGEYDDTGKVYLDTYKTNN